jgi:hypothetical protein
MHAITATRTISVFLGRAAAGPARSVERCRHPERSAVTHALDGQILDHSQQVPALVFQTDSSDVREDRQPRGVVTRLNRRRGGGVVARFVILRVGHQLGSPSSGRAILLDMLHL